MRVHAPKSRPSGLGYRVHVEGIPPFGSCPSRSGRRAALTRSKGIVYPPSPPHPPPHTPPPGPLQPWHSELRAAASLEACAVACSTSPGGRARPHASAGAAWTVGEKHSAGSTHTPRAHTLARPATSPRVPITQAPELTLTPTPRSTPTPRPSSPCHAHPFAHPRWHTRSHPRRHTLPPPGTP